MAGVHMFGCRNMIANFIFTVLVGLFLNCNLHAKVKSENFFISNGERYVHEKKGFSIVPPVGWEVHTDYPNLSLLLQVPFSKGLVYQRTIQIMAFKKWRYIDEIEAREFEKIIVQRYSKISGSIKNFRVRNYMITRMEDEREGILYYTEFDLEDKHMMQAHILVSSDSRSLLLTYTDVIDHFEGDKASEYLTKAWESMASIKLGSDAPIRFQKTFFLGLIAICILILLILFYLIRHTRAAKTYTDHAQSEHLTEDDLKSVSEHDDKDKVKSMVTDNTDLDDVSPDSNSQPLSGSTELDADDDDEWSFSDKPDSPAPPPPPKVEVRQNPESEYSDEEDDEVDEDDEDVWK